MIIIVIINFNCGTFGLVNMIKTLDLFYIWMNTFSRYVQQLTFCVT